MASQNLSGQSPESKSRDERLERLEALRNDFIGIAYKIFDSTEPMTHTHLLMTADCSLRSVAEVCARCLEQPKQRPEVATTSARRGRKPESTQLPAWAEKIEGVVQ